MMQISALSISLDTRMHRSCPPLQISSQLFYYLYKAVWDVIQEQGGAARGAFSHTAQQATDRSVPHPSPLYRPYKFCREKISGR